MSKDSKGVTALAALQEKIVACADCPRLRRYCLGIAKTKRRAYLSDTYWGKPITGFGPADARLMVVGLAPAAHGANRTGRIFTGDRSGDWLYRALYRAGFANQPTSVNRDDGLRLKSAYVSCVVRCAPPDNKPSPAEIARCGSYLQEEIRILSQVKVWLALGQIALNGLWPTLERGKPKPRFKHGAKIRLSNGGWLLMSYHPSQQNTFTGRLTEPMFDSVFSEATRLIAAQERPQ
jgi:uracil-DNA glycosylase family 4